MIKIHNPQTQLPIMYITILNLTFSALCNKYYNFGVIKQNEFMLSIYAITRPPLWSSGQSSRGPGFDSRHYQIFWEIVGDTLYPQKLALTSLTSGGRSVGIVRLWTKVTEFICNNSLKAQKLNVLWTFSKQSELVIM
jgi:hypothetical protein